MLRATGVVQSGGSLVVKKNLAARLAAHGNAGPAEHSERAHAKDRDELAGMGKRICAKKERGSVGRDARQRALGF